MNNLKPIDISVPLVFESSYQFDTENIISKAQFFSSNISDFKSDYQDVLEIGDAGTTAFCKKQGPHTWPEFEDFNQWVGYQANNILLRWGYDVDSVVITDSWFNQHKKGGWTNFHTHSGSHLVLAAYVSAPSGTGDLKIIDPLEHYWSGYPTDINLKIAKGFNIKTETNKVVFFAPFLRHGTGVNETENDRWVLSMNISCFSKSHISQL
jgi:uncharacterized protein (TIGR02466 family)